MDQRSSDGGAAFEKEGQVYRTVAERTRVVVRGLLGDRYDKAYVIEEITQVTALEILSRERFGSPCEESERNKLICAVARNKCIDWLRSNRHEPDRREARPGTVEFETTRFPSFTESIAAFTRTPSSILGWREIGAFAIAAIGRLPDSQREPVIFYLLGGMKTPEIASSLGEQRPAVANRVKRGLMTLRNELRRAFPDAGFDGA